MTLEGYEVVSKYVTKYGLNRKLPDHYKRRDDDEPRARQKEKQEDKLALEVRRRFRVVLDQLGERLQQLAAGMTAASVDDWLQRITNELLSVPEHEKEMMKVLISASEDGVDLFSESIGFDINWTQVNDEAAEWARTYTTEWLEGLKNTERDRIRTELSNFIEQEGYTIGDVVDGLKQSGFDDARSQRIATTEITRAYGESAQIGAERLQEEFPDVEVIKTWFTNRDGLVCPICAPLNDKTVPVDEDFTQKAGPAPPAHVNCRCWIQYRTSFLGEAERGEYIARDNG